MIPNYSEHNTGTLLLLTPSSLIAEAVCNIYRLIPVRNETGGCTASCYYDNLAIMISLVNIIRRFLSPKDDGDVTRASSLFRDIFSTEENGHFSQRQGDKSKHILNKLN